MPETQIKPSLCSFCEEEEEPQPPAGRMLVVIDGTFDEIAPSKFVACEPCGRAFSGRPCAENPKTGEIAVFQFEHYLFPQVADQVTAFAVYLDSVHCQVCEEKIYEPDAPLEIIAGRMLRIFPDAHFLKATCPTCQAIQGCQDCSEHDDHN